MNAPTFLKTCSEVKEFLMDFLDKKLSLADSMKFKMHMVMCTPCKMYMTRYDTSVKLAQNILDDPPPPELINLTNEFLKKNLPRE